VVEEERRKRSRPTVYEWENELVIIYYTGAPFPGSPYEIEKGSPESRAGLFGLDEVSDLGVIVRKIGKGEDDSITYEHPVFIPWGSVHFMERLEDYIEEAGQGEKKT
jgi:hypothetical protein